MHIQTSSVLETFLDRLCVVRSGVLMLDFDGTIAPFSIDRKCVRIYPSLVPVLASIIETTETKVAIVSGRCAHEIRALIAPPWPEIWGSHGMERLFPDGAYETAPGLQDFDEPLERAALVLEEGLLPLLERKVGCLALHWRGLPKATQIELKSKALEAWTPIATASGIAVTEFDGGLELRAPLRDKGDAVRTLVKESPKGFPIAYLGDDITDEAAFHAIAGFGLGVLVRSQLRLTAAQIWLRPPQDVLGFLERWLNACGGAR